MTKTEIEFIKDQIKQTLSLKEIIEFYAGEPNKYTKRYKCPFNHEEHHCNLEVKDRYWRCFSCNLSGDEIEFVRLLFNFNNFQQALTRIASDFGLKTYTKPDAEYEKKVRQIKNQRARTKWHDRIYTKRTNQIYNAILNRQRQLEQIIKVHSPYNPKKLERYALTDNVDIVINAVKQFNANETVVKIMLGYDLDEYESFIYGSAITIEEKNDLKKKIIYDIINGKIKINKKGDVISSYGFKFQTNNKKRDGKSKRNS